MRQFYKFTFNAANIGDNASNVKGASDAKRATRPEFFRYSLLLIQIFLKFSNLLKGKQLSSIRRVIVLSGLKVNAASGAFLVGGF